MLSKALVVVGVISAVLLIVILNTTTPDSAGATGVLGVFIVGYLLVLSALTFLLFGISKAVTRVTNTITVQKPVESLSLRRAYYYSTVIAFAPVIIVSMQSVGGVGVYELGLIILLVAIGCLYVTKRTT